MPKQSEKRAGYDEACNDLATALTELRRIHRVKTECVDIPTLVARFKELKALRFSDEQH